MLDVLCEWYAWTWAYAGAAAPPPHAGAAAPTSGYAEVRFGYGINDGVPSTSVSEGDATAHPQPTTALPEVRMAVAPWMYTRAIPRPGELDWRRHPGGVEGPAGGDLVAGAFYLLALCGEYTAEDRDGHDRVPARALPHVRRGFARVPLADRLLALLAADLQSAAVPGSPRPSPARQRGRSTLDLDAATAIAGKRPLRMVSSVLREVRTGQLGRVLATLLRRARDPFDTFGYVRDLHRDRGIRPLCFLLLGYGSALDPGWAVGDARWPRLVQTLGAWADLEVHPSYGTYRDAALLRDELARFATLTGHEATALRRHYLRLEVPRSLRECLRHGIAEDHTLGWADEVGFRSGTARAYPWYDLEREAATALRLVPFAAMDTALRYALGSTPAQASALLRHLAAEANCSGAGLRVVWHNSNLGPLQGWSPWRRVYEGALDLVAARASAGSAGAAD